MRLQWIASMILTLLLVKGLALGGQAPIPGGEMPIDFIPVKQVAQLLNDGARVVLVDVRSRQDYLIRHIKGAESIPLDSIDARASEIPRDGLVILY
jgi:hypothetical protein